MRTALRAILFGIDRDAQLWRTAVLAAGGAVSGPQLARVSMLIRALKDAAVWYTLDRLWLFAAENSAQALIDLKARATATLVNAPVFTVNRGFIGNGTSAYINSGFNPSTAPSPNFVQNNASLGVWVVAAPTATGGFECGSEVGPPFTVIGARFTATNYSWGIDSTAPVSSPSGSNWIGAFHQQRTGSSTQTLYLNGASGATDSTTSTTVNTGSFSFLAQATSTQSTAQIGMGWIGASLNAGQLAGLYAAQRAYMTAVGVP